MKVATGSGRCGLEEGRGVGGGVALVVGNRPETERRRRARRRCPSAPGELIMDREEAQREGVVVWCWAAVQGLIL